MHLSEVSVNIATKMKRDWDRRARHHARFWIATEDYSDEESFAASGEATRTSLRVLLGERCDPSWSVLEVGCGIGRILRPLAGDFARLYGVDVSGEMITRARERLAGLENVQVFESSGVDLSRFAAGSIDLAYSWVAFQHMPRPVFAAYLAELNRVLVPGGLLAFQLFLGQRSDPDFEDTVSLRTYAPADVRTMLASAGFAVLSGLPGANVVGSPVSASILAERCAGIHTAAREDLLAQECLDAASPLDDRLHRLLAVEDLRKGEIRGAIDALWQLVRVNPKHLIGWSELATLLIDTRRLDEAVVALESMVRANPEFEPARRRLAELRRAMPPARTKLPREPLRPPRSPTARAPAP